MGLNTNPSGMRYYHANRERDGRTHLVARADGDWYDLTAGTPALETFADLSRTASATESTIDDVVRDRLDTAPTYEPASNREEEWTRPVEPAEVWAAGVTYRISEQAREAESSMPDLYLDVYESDRPELFFKATPGRLVGPNEHVGVRGDSTWDVPEPELGVVLYRGEIVGYTVGNDVSSRAIEGENTLYLPQAKTYDRCCAIGPCVRSAASLADPHALEMWMTIGRDGMVLYDESTTTGKMKRTVEELVGYYRRHNAVPELSVLLTGTSLVPDDSFTLREGDTVEIGIEGIGTLTNTVVEV